MISFTVPSIPVAQPRQRHRVATINGHTMAMNYTPGKHPVNAFKASVQHAANAAYQGPPIEGPLFLRLVFVMPRPGRLIWKSRPMPRCRHQQKPDIDNLAKSVKDALKGIVWRDDSQVCSAKWSKWIAAGDEQPHVEIEIRTIDDQ